MKKKLFVILLAGLTLFMAGCGQDPQTKAIKEHFVVNEGDDKYFKSSVDDYVLLLNQGNYQNEEKYGEDAIDIVMISSYGFDEEGKCIEYLEKTIFSTEELAKSIFDDNIAGGASFEADSKGYSNSDFEGMDITTAGYAIARDGNVIYRKANIDATEITSYFFSLKKDDFKLAISVLTDSLVNADEASLEGYEYTVSDQGVYFTDGTMATGYYVSK